MKKRKVNKKKIDRIVKNVFRFLSIVCKVAFVAVAVYAVYNRIMEIDSISFFFTTWK